MLTWGRAVPQCLAVLMRLANSLRLASSKLPTEQRGGGHAIVNASAGMSLKGKHTARVADILTGHSHVVSTLAHSWPPLRNRAQVSRSCARVGERGRDGPLRLALIPLMMLCCIVQFKPPRQAVAQFTTSEAYENNLAIAVPPNYLTNPSPTPSHLSHHHQTLLPAFSPPSPPLSSPSARFLLFSISRGINNLKVRHHDQPNHLNQTNTQHRDDLST